MMTLRGSETVDERLLVERARRGDRGAFEALYREHADEAWRLALAVGREPVAAGDAVAEAFGKVLAPADRSASDRQVPARLSLLAATRNAAVDDHRLGGTAVHTEVVAQSFERLPERWRSVLWLIDVEGLDADQAGIVLGVSAEGTAQLVARAHAGLHEQVAQAQVRSATQEACQRTALRLGGYVTNTLSPRDATRVRRHLDRCAACRDRLDEVDDLTPQLRRSVLPLPLLVLGAAEQAWASRSTDATGPLGLTLPSGRPVPPWAERAVAGAAAAVITLGITGAILAGGRGGKSSGGQLASGGTEQPIGAPDGESALGGRNSGATDRPIDDGVASAQQPAGPADADTASSGDPAARSVPDQVPRGGRGPLSAPPPAGPVAPGGPNPVDPPATPPAPPTAGAPIVVIRLDDSTGVSVGGTCTGAEVLDIVVGCEPPGGSNTIPVALPTPPLPGL